MLRGSTTFAPKSFRASSITVPILRTSVQKTRTYKKTLYFRCCPNGAARYSSVHGSDVSGAYAPQQPSVSGEQSCGKPAPKAAPEVTPDVTPHASVTDTSRPKPTPLVAPRRTPPSIQRAREIIRQLPPPTTSLRQHDDAHPSPSTSRLRTYDDAHPSPTIQQPRCQSSGRDSKAESVQSEYVCSLTTNDLDELAHVYIWDDILSRLIFKIAAKLIYTSQDVDGVPLKPKTPDKEGATPVPVRRSHVCQQGFHSKRR